MPTKRIYLTQHDADHIPGNKLAWTRATSLPTATNTVPFEPALPRCGAPRCVDFVSFRDDSPYAECDKTGNEVPADGSGYCWRHSANEEKSDA